jgi:hypothetical protein
MPHSLVSQSPKPRTAAEGYYTTHVATVPAMVYDQPSNGMYDPTALGQGHVSGQYGRPTSEASGNGITMWIQRPDSLGTTASSQEDPIAFHPSQNPGMTQPTSAFYPTSAAAFYGAPSPPPEFTTEKKHFI